MKVFSFLPFAAAATALVLPWDDLRDVAVEAERHSLVPCASTIVNIRDKFLDKSKELFDDLYEDAEETSTELKGRFFDTVSDVQAWTNEEVSGLYEAFEKDKPHHGHDPHHKPNQTIYQLIAESKYTTKLAKLISKYDDLVDTLNSTKANFTVFAPIDKAFDEIPDDAPEPSKEQLKKLLSYHVVPDVYPAGRVLFAHTAPTLLKSDSLGDKPLPQRVSFQLGLKGITVNFYSSVVAPNIFATNGVIHGVRKILFPPIGAIKEIELFPGYFSTLELGLDRTGLLDKLDSTDHPGGTLFAPNNDAFARLGPKLNAFLFSKHGLKYLKALLEYHVVPANTLYSDAYYKSSKEEDVDTESRKIHVELPTFLKGRTLSVDIARYGVFYVYKVNGFNNVAVQDVVAEDGVIQIMSRVIIPPKKLSSGEFEQDDGGELTVEGLMERLEPYVDHDFKSDL